MVPMFATTSSRLIPMPLSDTESTRAFGSTSRAMENGSSGSRSEWVSPSKRRRSMASDAFEISSRRKTSRFE